MFKYSKKQLVLNKQILSKSFQSNKNVKKIFGDRQTFKSPFTQTNITNLPWIFNLGKLNQYNLTTKGSTENDYKSKQLSKLFKRKTQNFLDMRNIYLHNREFLVQDCNNIVDLAEVCKALQSLANSNSNIKKIQKSVKFLIKIYKKAEQIEVK